jgi:hypothetical protein
LALKIAHPPDTLLGVNEIKTSEMMKRATFLTVLLAVCAPVQAAFLDDGWGARPIGMGGAFTAIADDANAPLYNPAGLVQVQSNELTAMYSVLYSGLTLYSGNDTTGGDTVHLGQNYLAYVSKPIDHIGSFGVTWANFNVSHLYREDTVALSYARTLGDLIPALENNLSLGLNLKYLRHSYTLDSLTNTDSVFAGGSSASAMTLDAGALYKFDQGFLDGLRLGVAGKNLTNPNVGLQQNDLVPIEWRFGTAYQNRQMPWLVPALDVSLRNGIFNTMGGIESWLFGETLGLRAGGNNDEAAAGLSYYQPLGKKFGFRLDYGFTVPFYVQDTNGSHRFQITVYF